MESRIEPSPNHALLEIARCNILGDGFPVARKDILINGVALSAPKKFTNPIRHRNNAVALILSGVGVTVSYSNHFLREVNISPVQCSQLTETQAR